jgi:elongation factor Ts
MPEAKITAIANGRLQKFFKESTLMNQAYISDSKVSIAQYLESVEKGLVATGFVRFGLKN